MKKIFTLLCGMLLATGAFAELGYNATLTQGDFNNSNTVVKKQGTIEWDGDHVRCGGSSNGISLGGPSWNWDDKYFDVKIANGVPNKLTFEWACNNVTSTQADWYVKESADGKNWSAAIWETTSSTASWTSVTKDLQPNTRYIRFCFSGNFAGNFRNIKVTEKILMGTPNPTSLDFGTVKVDDEASMSFTLGWTNLTATVTGGTDQFTVTPESFGQIGAYTQTATISVALNTSVAGEYSTTVHVEGRGKSADVPVTAKVEKYDQTINWDAAASYNYGEAIPVAVATSGLDVVYEISDASVLKFENGAFVALHGGDVTVTVKQAGNYKYNAAADVVKTITIVPPTTYGEFEQTTCDEAVEFNNQTYEESFADDVNVGENYLGGDSIVHVNIVINHATFGTDEMTIVYGDDEEWNGIALKDSTVGVHYVEFVTTNVAGCDSTVTLTLTVNKIETLRVDTAFAFCAGGSETFHGKIYTEAVEADEIQAEGETRDTLYVVNVTVLQPTTGTDEMTITVGKDTTWNDIALKDSTVGVHYVVFETTNVAGCDSTVTLTLTVNKMDTLNVPVDLKFCAGGSEDFHGKTYTEAIKDTILAIGETRDTLYFVNVTVLQPSFVEEDMTIIVGTDTAWNGIALKDSTVGVYTIVYETTNVAGCDSTVTLTLTVNKMDTLKVYYPIGFCAGDSAEYRGKWYYESGEDTILVEDAIRDTLIYVTVAVLPEDLIELNEDTLHVGDTLFIEAGVWYMGDELMADTIIVPVEEGLFDLTRTLKNEYECDSVIVRHVVVEAKPQDQGDPTGLENVGEAQKAVKEFRNGVLYIRRGEKVYTVSGELVK